MSAQSAEALAVDDERVFGAIALPGPARDRHGRQHDFRALTLLLQCLMAKNDGNPFRRATERVAGKPGTSGSGRAGYAGAGRLHPDPAEETGARFRQV